MKKRRKKKGKKKVEYLQYINEIPTYEDPDIVSPTIEVILTLADNICPAHYGNPIISSNKFKKLQIFMLDFPLLKFLYYIFLISLYFILLFCYCFFCLPLEEVKY